MRFSRQLQELALDAVFLLKLRQFAFELLNPAVLGRLRWLATRTPWGESLAPVLCSLFAPASQLRAVNPFPAEQLSELTTLGAGVCFCENSLLVLRAEATSLTTIVFGFCHHFGGSGLWFRHWSLTSLAPRIVLIIREAAVSPVIGTGGPFNLLFRWRKVDSHEAE